MCPKCGGTNTGTKEGGLSMCFSPCGIFWQREARPLTRNQRANNAVSRLADAGISVHTAHAWATAAHIIENALRKARELKRSERAAGAGVGKKARRTKKGKALNDELCSGGQEGGSDAR